MILPRLYIKSLVISTLLSIGMLTGFSAFAEPDLTVCDGTDCDNLPPEMLCSSGFLITFQGRTENQNEGTATYTYEICNKHTTDCPFSPFRDLSHFDIVFPEIGNSPCVPANTEITGTCSTGSFVLGDGSCFDGGSSNSFIAKCDNTNLPNEQCMTMTVTFATTQIGVGPAIVVDKAATNCVSSCIVGPSCDDCDVPPNDCPPCITRNVCFWSTHPWITNKFAPVTVCGIKVGCKDYGDGKSKPSCGTGKCYDIMEALGSSGKEYPENPAYVELVKQLTAAKLNLKASDCLFKMGACEGYKSHDGKSIEELVLFCENLCDEDPYTIVQSGCLPDLKAFNESKDTGFKKTPRPFNCPSKDDYGHKTPNDKKAVLKAQRDGIVIGKGQCK